MKISEVSNDDWLYCSNKHAPQHGIGKLHAALSIEHFDQYHQRIYNLLKRAVEDGIIPAFKILNRGDSENLIKELGGTDVSILQNPNSRLYNNPFTIYLYENPNVAQISDLCKQLEYALAYVPEADERYISSADLKISEHITYRVEKIDGDYIAIATASKQQLDLLKKEAESSATYIALTKQMNKQAEQITQHEKTEQNNQRENEIQGFYNKHYAGYNESLHSEDIQKQVYTSCAFLQIDWNALSKEKDLEKRQAILNRQYRLAAKRYHSDHLQPTLVDTVEKANELFSLATLAKRVLDTVIIQPELIDKSKILEQEKHHANHQYELKTGFSDKPYDYSYMAKDTSYVSLFKNWEYISKKIEVTEPESNSLAIQLHMPELKLYERQSETVIVHGYEAFYLLFMANALPRSFGQYHLNLIFSDNLSTKAEKWLLEKVLTTPEFIGFLDTYDLISLSKRATEIGLLNIGGNSTEVFQYYYLNYPETLYKRRLERITNEKDFNWEIASEVVIQNPENLRHLDNADVLIKNQKIKEFIWQDKELSRTVISNYHMNYMVFEPFFKKSGRADVEKVALKEIFHGNTSFLLLLSENSISQLMKYVDENKDIFPTWLNSEMGKFLEKQTKKRDIIMPDQTINDTSYNARIDAYTYIKTEFIASPTIVNFLNKDALIWLASEPEISYLHYLAIAEALVNLNEDDAALRYLKKLATEIGVASNNLSAKDILFVLKEENLQKEINNMQKEEKAKAISSLMKQYESVLRGNEAGDLNEIKTKFDYFKISDKVYQINQKYEDDLKNQFYLLLDRLKKGDNSKEIKQEFFNLQIRVNTSQLSWKDICERDRDNKFLEGGKFYKLIRYIINIIDRNAVLFLDENEGMPIPGFPLKTNTLEALEQVFFLHQCLGIPSKFYDNLFLILDINKEVASVIADTEKYDQEKVQELLVYYLDNELSVYGDGYRKNAAYKTFRYRDDQNIKPFNELYSLYNRLDKVSYFENHVPALYTKLLFAERQYKPENHKKPPGNSYHITGSVDYPDNPNRPLMKYIEVRKYSEKTNFELEKFAVQYELFRIVNHLYRPLHEGEFFEIENNQALNLHREIVKIFHPNTGLQDQTNLSVITADMTGLISKFLTGYSDSKLYNQLTKAINESKILRDHFKLHEINDNKKIAYHIVKAIPQTEVNLLITNACPSVPALIDNNPSLGDIRRQVVVRGIKPRINGAGLWCNLVQPKLGSKNA